MTPSAQDLLVKLHAWDWKRRDNPHGLNTKDLQRILALPLDLMDLESSLSVDTLLRQESATSSWLQNPSAGVNGTVTILAETMVVMEQLDLGVPSPSASVAASMNIKGEDTASTLGEELSVRPQKSRPVIATAAELPIALVVTMLLLRALWYYRQHKSKMTSSEPSDDNGEEVATQSKGLKNGTNAANGSPSLVNEGGDEAAARLKSTLEREAEAKLTLAQENQALQQALDSHKATVDKFQTEMQARNDRLSVFEQEQDTVRRDLSAQIEVLKRELQERQKQEQGNLSSKENLCNDLIGKIQILNKDLENHEKLWNGVSQKANKKEVDSVAKVETLQQSLQEEQVQRAKDLALKEDKCAELAAKVKVLATQKEQQAAQQAAFEHTTQASRSTEAALQQRLVEEQEHTSSLTSKLQMFTAELSSRQKKVSNLDTKMNEVERLSRAELKALQRELDAQVQQRTKLEQAAQEMTRLLQERRDQCVRLSTQLESSKIELKTLENRVTALTSDVQKREDLATARLEALQHQLSDERQQCVDCQETVTTTSDELIKKQEEFVQLTARMDLFLTELQFREDQVASLESKLTDKEDLATTETKTLQAQLQVRQERRDEWNQTTDDLNQLLKDKQAQVVGLTTRFDLFERELQGRQEGVATLETKVNERQDAETLKMEPYRNELQRLQKERDDWKVKTDEINRMLQEKMRQTQGLKTRLHLFRAELAKKGERVDILKTTVEEKQHKTTVEMAPVRQKLYIQREQLDAWTSKTDDIEQTLKEKRAQCTGLKTRVDLFQQELQTKERVVGLLETKVSDRREVGGGAIATLKKHVIVHTMGRDEWRMSTKKVSHLLIDKKKEATDLTAQVKGLVFDLQSYQQRRALLESKSKERNGVTRERRTKLEEELKVLEDHRDGWSEKTEGLTQAMKDTEESIVGLETRALLFEKELHQRKARVASLEKAYRAMEGNSSSKRKQLLDELDVKKQEHEMGVEATLQLNKTLKATKRECIGLTTRAKLFTQELEKRAQLVSDQEEKINQAENETSVALEQFQTALFEKTKERDEWKQKTEGIARLCKQTTEETVGLGTRLDLFMVQVMEHEENVSRAEARLEKRRGFQASESFTKELEAAKEKRDEWTAKAIDIERTLKEKRGQMPGLQTRHSLFRVELSRLDDLVGALQLKISEKQKASDSKIAPLKHALAITSQQRDEWKSQTEKIDRILNEKQEQCLPIAGRLEACIDDLTHCKEYIDEAETQLREEEDFAADQLVKTKFGLEDQQGDLRHWEDSTKKVHQLLREKYLGTDGLKTRMIVFGGELQKRVEAVSGAEAKIADNVNSLADELGSINEQIEAEHQERDRIIEATLAGNQALTKMEETCGAVTVRCKLFDEELRQREDRVTQLEAKLQEKEFDFSAQMKALKDELANKRSDRDKWSDTTRSMDTLLNKTERECVGLATRLQLFLAEKKNYDEQVAMLEAQVNHKESESAELLAPLRIKLKEEQDDRDSWDKKTVELDCKLEGTKREVIGLYTRSKLFRQELGEKEKGVATLDAKITKKDGAFAERMGPLMKEYNTHREDRDAWEKSTLNVENMLEKTENECASIPTRLDLFRREQQTREDAVAELDAKIKNKEDLVAIQFGFLLNELKLQQKHRGKWKKVTLEMHRLLKETKERVASLTNKLETTKNDLKERQERVTGLETSLRDGRDMVAQQLKTLKNEILRQRDQRDKLSQSCATLARHLEEAKEQCTTLSEKLEESGSQVESCTQEIEKLQSKVGEKQQLDAAQIESITEQHKVHLEQQSEWEQNTNQMKRQLKEKHTLCTSVKTKLALLKKLENGEGITSSLAPEASGKTLSGQNGFSTLSSMGVSNSLAKKTKAEEALTSKMESLEKEISVQQSDSAEQFERELKEKENQQSNLNSKLEVLTSELMDL